MMRIQPHFVVKPMPDLNDKNSLRSHDPKMKNNVSQIYFIFQFVNASQDNDGIVECIQSTNDARSFR